MKHRHRIIFALGILVLAILIGILYPRNIDYFSRAELCAREGDLRQAYSLYKKAINQAPPRAAAFEGMGKTIQRIGWYPRALPFFEKACAMEPRNLTYLEDLYWAYFLNERLDDALAVGRQLVDCAPNGSMYCAYVAEVHLMRAFTDRSALSQAREYLKMADDSSYQTGYVRGKIHFFEGDYPGAIRDFESVSMMDMSLDDAEDLSFLLCQAYLRSGRDMKARELLHRMIALANCTNYITYWRSFPYPEFAMLTLSTYFEEKFQEQEIYRLKARFRELKKGGVKDMSLGRTTHVMFMRLIQIHEMKNPGKAEVDRALECWQRVNRLVEKEYGRDRQKRGNPICFSGRIAMASYQALYNVYLGDLYRGIRPVQEVRGYYEKALKIDGEDCMVKRKLDSLPPADRE